MIAAQRSDGFFNYPRSKLIAIRYLKSQDEGTLPCFFPLPRSTERREGTSFPRPFLLSRSDGSQGCRGAANAIATGSRANMHSFIGCRIRTTFVGRQLSTGGRPRKTPPFDYSSTVAKEKPQGRGLGRNDFRAPSKGQGAGRRTEMGGGERKRKRGRGAKNEVKFIRVQTDVNLFKLRDFGSGRGGGAGGREGGGRRGGRGGGRWGLLRRDGSGSICFITARDKGWAWSEKDSILREIKKSAGLSFRSRFSDRKREACGPVPWLACASITRHGHRISRYATWKPNDDSVPPMLGSVTLSATL